MLIQKYAFSTSTIQQLKKLSATYYFSDPKKALAIATVAHKLGKLLSDPLAVAWGRWTMANALMFTNQYQKSDALFRQARTGFLAAGDQLNAARMGVGHIWALAYLGKLDEAQTLADRIEPVLALSSIGNTDDLTRLASLYNNVGIAYELSGQFEEALAAYEKKLQIVRSKNNQIHVARAQHNRALCLMKLNMFSEAAAAFYAAADIFTREKLDVDLARLYTNRARFFALQKMFAAAKEDLQKAEQLLEAKHLLRQQQTLTIYRALVILKSDEPVDENLCKTLAVAQSIFSQDGPVYQEGLAWIAIGHCRLKLGQLLPAQNAFEKAMETTIGRAEQTIAYLALHGLGISFYRQGQTDLAIQHYLQSIDKIERMRTDFRIETFRAGFLFDKTVVYQELALIYARNSKMDYALFTIERVRGRILLERMYFKLVQQVSRLTTQENDQLNTVAKELSEVLTKLETLYHQAQILQQTDEIAAENDQKLQHLLANIEEFENRVNVLVRQIERSQPLFASAIRQTPDTLTASISATLHNELLLEYHYAAGYLWVFVITSRGIQAHIKLCSTDELETAQNNFSIAVTRLLGIMAQYAPEVVNRFQPSLLADIQQQLQNLYALLLQPAAEYLKNHRTVIISPVNVLHYIPFHALYDGKEYTIEKYDISYTPSLSVLNQCCRPKLESRHKLIMGYNRGNLAQISTEVATVHKFFPDAKFFVSTEATCVNFLNEVRRYGTLDFIHLATHAQFRADNTMLSYFEMADRRLTLAEIARLNLDINTVVLSGCETGTGQLYGEDLFSLAGGFLGAGVQSIVVSLWQVEDRMAAYFMEHFYQSYTAGASRVKAIAAAQRQIIQFGREHFDEYAYYTHPAYWAPFILIGNWQ